MVGAGAYILFESYLSRSFNLILTLAMALSFVQRCRLLLAPVRPFMSAVLCVCTRLCACRLYILYYVLLLLPQQLLYTLSFGVSGCAEYCAVTSQSDTLDRGSYRLLHQQERAASTLAPSVWSSQCVTLFSLCLPSKAFFSLLFYFWSSHKSCLCMPLLT